ncbi:MAG TPA: protein kinase [Caldimonas sp.]|nr:protein kinase [Caldimonas sp.]HEX4234272.1 protein kinase [Caldimonas sp.]
MNTHPPTASKPSVAAAGSDHDALPAGTRFGEFEIVRVLGVGGFGIVYLARDDSLEREVALKEYMPASLAARGAGPQITVRSSAFAETYAIGLRSFINEARLLARFDHPSLVKVYRFWEDNATAYMVMPFLQGTTLRDTRRRMAHPPDEAWIRSVLAPILSALELLHREGVYHRDIAPDNILLPRDGPPVLLDFGAARRVISDRTQSLTAILKPSYAPIEQYAEMTQLRQGPWTDLYALGAVVHYLVFGVPPAPATARAVAEDGDAIENRVVAGISPRFLEAMSWMLAVRPSQRPQSGEQLRAVLDGNAEIPPRRPSGTTIPGAFPSTSGTTIEQAADATRIDPASVPTHMPAASPRPLGATTSFSPTTQMPTARTTPLVGRDAPAAASLPPQSAVASFASSRPATLAPGASTPPRRPPAAEPAVSRPVAPSRPAVLATPAAEVPRVARSRQRIALVGGGVVALLAVAAAIQFAGRPEGAVAVTPAPASTAMSNVVPVPSTVPAAMSTGPSELILDAPQGGVGSGSPTASKPVPPLPPADAGVAARSSAPLDAAQAASGAHARPPGRPASKLDDGADGVAAGGNAASLGAAGATQPRPPGSPPLPRDPHAAQRPPQAATQAEPQTASEACARLGGGFFARNVCLDEKCEEARYRNVGECPAVLARKRQREH